MIIMSFVEMMVVVVLLKTSLFVAAALYVNCSKFIDFGHYCCLMVTLSLNWMIVYVNSPIINHLFHDTLSLKFLGMKK